MCYINLPHQYLDNVMHIIVQLAWLQWQCTAMVAVYFSLQGSGKTLAFGIPILQYILNNNCSMNYDTTGRAQKHDYPAKPKKHTANRKSDGDTYKSLKGKRKKESKREENVIDLNEVLHEIEMGETAEISDAESEDSEVETESLDQGGAGQPFLDEMETDEQTSSSGSELGDNSGEHDVVRDLPAAEGSFKGSKGKAKMDAGLVGFKDDIPDEEFQKMIAGDLDPWESDVEKTKSHNSTKKHCSKASKSECQSPDIKAESHDSGHGGGLIALILAPTRELAIQVHDHLTAVAKFTDIKVHMHVQYHTAENFSLDKNFTKPSYPLYIAEIFSGINFYQCGKDLHIFYVIINTGQKI